MEGASHASHSTVHQHALPTQSQTPQQVPSQLTGSNMANFVNPYPGQSPQSPVVPPSAPLNVLNQSQLGHISSHSQLNRPLRPGTLSLPPPSTPTGSHHTMHHFGPHAHPPHIATPSAHAQAPHLQPSVQSPQPVGSQTPTQSQPPTIIQIRFFGHESRQMIPPEFCLIGCVFYIAPYYLESPNTTKIVPGWRRQIEKFGGRVIDNYLAGPNNGVTHVVTENMSTSLAKVALQDGKRCVTIFWLEDVLCNKRLLPPWRFYHLPVAYGDTKPCRNHVRIIIFISYL